MSEKTTYEPQSGGVFIADKLLPCPFCGCEPELKFICNDIFHSRKQKVEIKCSRCSVKMVNSDRQFIIEHMARTVIEMWNKRENTK
ncbi:Lar family restriction alleviation protein [Patescibacteria group bacterium]|nr:Lar family restriction alleviation protein [Patescibacteria group bacterium]